MNARLDSLLAAIVRTSLESIIVIDEAGLVVEFNPAAEAAFGYSRAFALGKPIGELIVPEHLRDAHQKGLARYLREGNPHVLNRRVEIAAQRANGEMFPVELAITEVLAADGRYFAASLRDLTNQRAIEAARDDSEARLNAFMEHAPLGMYLKDAQGRYILVNPEFCRMFGMPAADLLGKSAEDLLASPEEVAIVRASDAQVLRTLTPMAVEEYLDGRDDYSWTLVMRFPLWSGAAKEWRIGGFDIDITPLKRASEEVAAAQNALHQSEKLNALGGLLAGVSHELNNPLSVVIAQAAMLEMQTEGTPLYERAARIKRAAERCAKIVQTFLAMAKQKPPQRAPFCLNATIESALDLMAYNLRSHGITPERDLAADLPLIVGDQDQLHQVVLNLISNAIQALETMDDARWIRLETGIARDKKRVYLEVHDTGPGIPAAIANRIFDPFFTTKAHGKGTGLGLSFSRAIVEGHGGELSLMKSRTGARLRLSLPVERLEAAAPETAGEEAPGFGPLRALIVDDEAEVAQSLAEMLGLLGLQCDVAATGPEGLERIRKRRFDLILSDLRMPGLDGEALHARLVASHPGLIERLAFVTGDTLGTTAEAFLKRAGRPVLMKPFDFGALRQLLRDLGLERP
jgi:PAS domain S-box-containing protein